MIMASEQSVHDWLVYEYGDRDFNQLCQALMWQQCNRFGSAPVSYASAIDAWYATPTAGSGVGPPGSFTFYDIGSYGHVDWVMDSGNADMGSSRVVEDWGWTNRGWKNGWNYSAETGATILGWGWTNGQNTCPYDGGSGGGGTVDYAWGLSTECQAALQNAMAYHGRYSGPQDGIFGENSVMGMQQWLKDMGRLPGDYAVDGIPGPAYGTALQELARDEGNPRYTGPIDGEPGQNTSDSLIGWAYIQTHPDPGPGPEPEPDPEIPATPEGTFFGVDVGSSQAGFDFNAYAAAGGQAVIIKAGGGNASDSPYVAPHYNDQLAAADAANVLIGHYWFNGRENGLTPTSSAQYFIDHIDLKQGDIVALDVEDETDTGTTHYSPAEVLEFVTAVGNLIPNLKVLIYMSASVVKSEDWSEVVAAGHPLWVASWGANDGTIPATGPDIDDWPDWSVWQYTSSVIVPGFADRVDGNVVKSDAWDLYGYTPDDPDPEPEPEPGDGVDEDLRVLTAGFFSDLATLASEYHDLVDELPPAPEDDEDDEASGRHRR